jgi:hypothetical protein
LIGDSYAEKKKKHLPVVIRDMDKNAIVVRRLKPHKRKPSVPSPKKDSRKSNGKVALKRILLI